MRLGVLGCADIARRRVLPAVAALPDIELAAVASRDGRRAEALAAEYGCAPVTGYRRLLERADIDAVYVPLPAALHAEWTERALLAGKHVLAEKPLTTTVRRTAELVALAGSRGLVLMENFMFLHHGQHAAVRRLLDGGAVGELRSFTAAFTVPPRPPTDIRYAAELGGGALLDVGVYPLRAAQLFLGTQLSVLDAVLRRDPARGVDVAGEVSLRSADGTRADVVFGMEHAYRSSYELVGAGRIAVDRAFTPPATHRPTVVVETAAGTEKRVLEPDDQVGNTLRSFARAVRQGASEPWGAWAVALAALVEAVIDRASRRAQVAPMTIGQGSSHTTKPKRGRP